MGRLSQASAGFWYEKLKSQLELLKTKREKESLERAYSLDIGLAYLFLYLFAESTIDYLARHLFPHAHQFDGYKKYKSTKKNIYQKIEYIFSTFCADLPFQAYADLKKKVEPITRMRNKVAHLEEMIWNVEFIIGEDGNPPSKHTEIPTEYTKDLTIDALRQYYQSVWEFLDVFKVILNEGFKDKEIEVAYDGEKRTRNLVDYVYEVAVVPPKNRIEF